MHFGKVMRNNKKSVQKTSHLVLFTWYMLTIRVSICFRSWM